MIPENKEIAQRHIEISSIVIWAGLSILSLIISGMSFAQGVFLGGAICIINYQWLYRHAKTAIILSPKSSSSFMKKRSILRLTVMGAVIFALITWTKINIVALLLGLSVVVMGIIACMCFTYIFTEGD
ncbi:MAG: ATP synthase subunit I [Thermodesulfobacteriota bacterium]|nr:ATP synthase subunit I [Thermodesulfobacteriota bacterium]